jgi:hypothetical protein
MPVRAALRTLVRCYYKLQESGCWVRALNLGGDLAEGDLSRFIGVDRRENPPSSFWSMYAAERRSANHVGPTDAQ